VLVEGWRLPALKFYTVTSLGRGWLAIASPQIFIKNKNRPLMVDFTLMNSENQRSPVIFS